jgi:crotonobetaine/carnitine-CoA ligase
VTSFPATIPELLSFRASRAAGGGKSWLFFEADSYTLADVVQRVNAFANALSDRGVSKGDRVAMVLGNRPETLFAWLAANQLGAIAMPLNAAYKPAELAGVLEVTTPKLIVVGGESRSLVESARSSTSTSAGTSTIITPDDLSRSGSSNAARADVRSEDVAVLLPTSGTTGSPKAVMITHRTFMLTAEAFPWWLGLSEDDRLLAVLPFFHVNAQAYSTMGALGCGASLALVTKFSASRFWEEAKRLGATQVNAVGAMVSILSKTAPRAADRDHSIRLVYAGLALSEEQHRAFEERFGVKMTVGYGLSECTFGTIWPPRTDGDAPRYGTMGKLRQHPRLGEINRARVVLDDGSDAPDGTNGELWLDNPAVTPGYFGNDAATAAAFETRAGERGERDRRWFLTGDIVRRDADGFYTFVARKKDVIRRRGENVAAAEIEGVLAAHPEVKEAAVKGFPSDLGEEEIAAYVVLQPNASPNEDALKEWVRARLADFKVPTRFHFRDSLPKTPTERVAKHLL